MKLSELKAALFYARRDIVKDKKVFIFITAASWILLFAGFILFLAVYLTSAPLVGAINQVDVNNLRTMFSGLGIISRLLEMPLKIIEKVFKTRNSELKLKENGL